MERILLGILISKIYFLNNCPVLIKRVATRISRQCNRKRMNNRQCENYFKCYIGAVLFLHSLQLQRTSWNKLTSHHCDFSFKKEMGNFLDPLLKNYFACVEHF